MNPVSKRMNSFWQKKKHHREHRIIDRKYIGKTRTVIICLGSDESIKHHRDRYRKPKSFFIHGSIKYANVISRERKSEC